jgi:acetylornithine deacetylase
VAIESVNPDLVPSGSGEGAIASFVASWLRAAGLEVTVVEPVPGRPSVVGVLRGSGGGKSLMLNAHMDTVGAGGMADAFTPVVRGGRVYGRGACDMKASLAAIMLAARSARSLKLKGDVIVTAVADEEVASLGTSAVLSLTSPPRSPGRGDIITELTESSPPRSPGRSAAQPPGGEAVLPFHADYAIVTEPTELRLCLAHKGFVWLEVETTGAAAHGSRSDLGVDAIAHMGPILSGVLDLNKRLHSGPRHGLLGTGSIHASLIEGGQEMSTYPARCIAKLERRTVPGEDGASVLREIEELSPPHTLGMARVGEELSPPHSLGRARVGARIVLERPPSEVAPDHPLSLAVAQAAGHPVMIGVAYWMDMALLNAAGIPCVAFGPEGEGEHADVEWVDVASVEKCVEVYLKAAEQLCN